MTRFSSSFDPAWDVFVVTPHASNPVTNASGAIVTLKGLRATGAGTVTIRTKGSSADLVHPVLDGERIDAAITHVRSMSGVTGLIGYAD